MDRKDFVYSYGCDGYTIYYKNKPIGGAGVKLPRSKPLRGNQAKENCKLFKESAEREIANILSGSIAPHMQSAIKEIDNEKEN